MTNHGEVVILSEPITAQVTTADKSGTSRHYVSTNIGAVVILLTNQKEVVILSAPISAEMADCSPIREK
jgi:hypothetical protein